MFRLEIETDNAAFDDKLAEIARILRGAAREIEDCARSLPRPTSKSIRDINGNSVGEWSMEERDA